MAWEGPQTRQSYNAGADFRTTGQFRFVVKNGTGDDIEAVNAATDAPIGVLQNNPNTNQEATVAHAGDTKLVAGGVINEGDRIGTDNQGRGVAIVPGTDVTKYLLGTALTPASGADIIFTASVDCPAAGRAA